MAHCPFMYACTDCRTVVSISCTVVHICMYNIAWRTRAHRPRTGRCAKFHFSLRNFLLPYCTTKVVTKYIFYENFSKFGRIKSKLMKKIWALRARNSGPRQGRTTRAQTSASRPSASRGCGSISVYGVPRDVKQGLVWDIQTQLKTNSRTPSVTPPNR